MYLLPMYIYVCTCFRAWDVFVVGMFRPIVDVSVTYVYTYMYVHVLECRRLNPIIQPLCISMVFRRRPGFLMLYIELQ
jgi:hypothetical protein